MPEGTFGDFENGVLVWKSESSGKLLLEEDAYGGTLTFIRTANPIVKTGHLVKESGDMILDVGRLGGKVLAKAGKAILSGRSSVGFCRGIVREADMLSLHYRKHREEKFNLDKIENPRFSCRIAARTVIDFLPGKDTVKFMGAVCWCSGVMSF